MKNLLQKKFITILLNIFLISSMLSVSFIFLTTTFLLPKYGITTLVVTFLLSLYLIKEKFVEKVLQKMNIKLFIICLVMTLMTLNEIRLFYTYENFGLRVLRILTNLKILRIFIIATKLFSMYALFLIYLYIFETIIPFIINFIKSFDKEEKKISKIYFLVMLGIIIFTYSLCSKMYEGYDLVFSLDTYYVSNYMFENIFWL